MCDGLDMTRRGRASPLILCAVAVATLADRQPAVAEGGAKLRGAEVRSMLVGKVIEYRTTKVPMSDVHASPEVGLRERTDGGWSVFRVFAREDGSILFRCTTHIRGGPGTPCPGQIEDVGTWSIEGDQMCMRFTSVRKGSEFCYEYHRVSGSIRVVQVRGPRTVLDGETLIFK